MLKKAAAAAAFIMILMISVHAAAFTIYYDGKTEDYPWEPITLMFEGQVINTSEMPPIILNGRTLVPAREFFEQLGADVRWIQSSKRVVIDYNDEKIIMSINSRTVFIGGRSIIIPSDEPAPKIINDKTMIPVRLVAEGFGFEVEWINDTRTVSIKEADKPEVSITKIKTGTKGGNDVIYVYATSYMEPEVLKLQSPRRLVFDFMGAEAGTADGAKEVDSDVLKAVRYSRHDEKFRVVADLNEDADYYIEEFASGVAITILGKGEEPSEPNTNVENPGDYIVVIDAGHGGTDPGAMFPAQSSNPEIREKDVTLDIALKVSAILKSKGVKVVMTRRSDTYPTLQDRVEIANNAHADLFVAIHCNSMETRFDIDGAQVYYHGSSTFGKKFAQIVYDKMVEYTGMTERGIQDGSSLYVIKNTSMPAILTEGGFVSNEKDREYLLSEEGREALANAIADGIMEALALL